MSMITTSFKPVVSITNETSDEPLSTKLSCEPIYCYDDNVTMNLSNYPNVTGTQNIIITTNNTGTISPNLIYQNPNTITLGPIHPTPLKIHGDAEVEGNLKVGGKNIGELIDKIEERLAILHHNTELEEKWDNLRELANKYRELEKEILEKEKIYDILKK